MVTNDDCTALEQGDIRFYDNFVPALGDGDYLINVTQQVNPQNTTPPIDESFAASQFFSVQGPRYTLPAGDIFSVFPPANAAGVFDQFLPNVVLTARELPWERNVFEDGDQAKQTPWLALLLFVAGEQIGGQDALLAPQVPNWSSNATMSANIRAADLYKHASGDGILWPKLKAEWYESADFLQQTVCSVIDVSPQAFTTLMPSKEDLRYLAHVRQVDPTAKDSDVLKIGGEGWYSVVVGNRLPDAPAGGSNLPGETNIVHLVSLEGLTDYVGGVTLPAGTKRVRLISLQSWTFTCLPELGESFSELMKGLLTDAKGDAANTSFVLPVAPPDPRDAAAEYAYRAIQNGYVPLSYQTRLGEQTFAWYRGPCSPVPVQNFISAPRQGEPDSAGWRPFARASDAIVYDKNYGVFDVSYGVAWETGRLLALSNANFARELLDWERKAHALLDLIHERVSQIPALKNFDPNNPDPAAEKTLLDLIQSYAMTGDFMAYLLTQFSAQIAPKFGDPPPSSPAPPFPPYPAMPSPPANPQTIQALLEQTDVQELVRAQGGQQLENMADWLAQLYLLVGVPFENLAANAALLPAESIRFFYLDSNWLGALVEGALSIGIESSRDRVYQDLMKDLVWDTTLAAVRQMRDKLLGSWAQKKPPQSDTPFDQESLTGMLLRSAVVSGWPGLQVQAFTQTIPDSAEPDITSLIQPLRVERLSADILLCLWPAVPAVVAIEEPHEGVAFGFEDPPDGHGEGDYLYLRSLDPADYGTPLVGSKYEVNAKQGLIDANRLVKIAAGGGLLDVLRKTLPNSPTVNVRDFAVQMVKVPEQAVFAAQALAPRE